MSDGLELKHIKTQKVFFQFTILLVYYEVTNMH